MVKTAALRSPRTRTSSHSSNPLQDVPGFHLFYKKKSMMQTDAWKSRYGLPSSHTFAQYNQWPCFFFEDFGGHYQNSTASPPAIHDSVNDAQRGAAFLCRLSESEYRHPLGFLSNMDIFRSQLYDGWPSFSHSGDNLVYGGPLPKTCPCSVTHKAFKGVRETMLFLRRPRWALHSGHGYCRLFHRSSVTTALGMAAHLQV